MVGILTVTMVEKLEKWAPIFIAVIALIFSISEGCENRKERRRSLEQHRIATQPRMSLGLYYRFGSIGEAEMEYTFTNAGLGPAEVKWFRVRVDGKDQKNWEEMFKALELNTTSIEYLIPGRFYRSQTGGVLLKIGPGPITVAFELKRHRIDMCACYCSVYQSLYQDECWIVTSDASDPTPVNSCLPAPKVEFSSILPLPEHLYPEEAK